MYRTLTRYVTIVIVSLFAFSMTSHAQFKEDVYSQSYSEVDPNAPRDSVDQLFSFKEFAGGLAHKNTLKVGAMFAGSVIVPGAAQIYNRDYWKLPIVYGGVGALAGTGGYYLHQYNKQKKAYASWETDKIAFETENGTPFPELPPAINEQYKKTGTWLMAGAGLMYWGTLLDGVINYESDVEPNPGRATIYSLLLPGLGQIYNGEFYKIPIYWGGMLVSVHMLCNNNLNYKRFKRIYNEATNPEINYTGNISADTAQWYRDVYRRYRDYSILATVAVYMLQVIDANVFAYMHDFEVSDDITMRLEPAVIPPNNAYALRSGPTYTNNSYGFRMGLRF